MAYGMKGHVGISFQQSFGTSFNDSLWFLPIINESVTENIPPIVSEGMRGRFEEGDSYEGAHDIGGDIVMPAHPILVGVALKAFMGQSSGALGTSEYTHTYKPRTIDFDKHAAVPPMTIEIYRDAGSGYHYYDCLCDGLTFEYSNNALINVTMSVIGGKFEKVAKSTPTYVAGSEFTFHQASLAIAGSAADDISQLTVTMNNALEGKGTLNNTKTFARIKRSDYRSFEIAGTALFEDDTQFDIQRAQTEQRLTIGTLGQACASGYNCKLDFDIPSIRYNEYPVNMGGAGMIEVSWSSAGKYNSGSATAIEVTLINSQSVY